MTVYIRCVWEKKELIIYYYQVEQLLLTINFTLHESIDLVISIHSDIRLLLTQIFYECLMEIIAYNLSVFNKVKGIVDCSIDSIIEVPYALVQFLIGNKRKHHTNTEKSIKYCINK